MLELKEYVGAKPKQIKEDNTTKKTKDKDTKTKPTKKDK